VGIGVGAIAAGIGEKYLMTWRDHPALLGEAIWAAVAVGALSLYGTFAAVLLCAASDLERRHLALQQVFTEIVQSLSHVLETRYTKAGDHSDRVADMAAAIAAAMGMSPEEVRDVRIAAYLHDVGKIGVHDDILVKRGSLTNEERVAVQRHAVLGYEILGPGLLPERIKLAVRHHHEWWDGNGYPDGLAGVAIPLAARVIAVADVYTALTADRPYRPALDPSDAVDDIRRWAGSQLDPQVVAAFLKVWQEEAAPAGARDSASARQVSLQPGF
jgi:putative nucleotidyltransferase with HDIG domain